MSRRGVASNSASNSTRERPPERPPDGQSGSARTERRLLWQTIWLLVNRANVALQLLGGALLVTLVDVEFMLRARAGWRLGPPNAPWPLWLMLAIPVGVTLLWLTLAILASGATFRRRQRQRQRQP
jgi:hypothetical protein